LSLTCYKAFEDNEPTALTPRDFHYFDLSESVSMSLLRLSFVLSISMLCSTCFAQGTKADYERANKLREQTRGKVFRDRVEPHWAGEHHFWYRVQFEKDLHEFIVVNAKMGKRETAFDHTKLAKALGKETNSELDANRLPFRDIRFFPEDNSIEFDYKGKWKLTRNDGKLAKIAKGDERMPVKQSTSESPGSRKDESKPDRPRSRRGPLSPDKKWDAIVKDHKLYLRDRKQGPESDVLISIGGSQNNSFNQGDVFWSGDSAKIIALQTKRGQDHEVSFVESSPRSQTQPKLYSHNYLKPGDKIPQRKPHLFDVKSKKEIPVSDELFPNPWLSTPRIEWAPDSSQCYYVYNQRGHQILRVVSIDATTGKTRAVVSEEPETFVDYAYKQFAKFNHAENEMVWMSERDGWNHLYIIDLKSGKVENQITKGNWVVRGVDNVDLEKRQIWFRASGINSGEDPYHIHFCRVNLDGTELTSLTDGDGTHSIKYSPNRKYVIDKYSRSDLPPITQVCRVGDGKKMCELERADWTKLLATGWKAPERFTSTARDGKTKIYGIIMRPTNFDPSKTYPIIEKIYAGPHGSFVPKSFNAYLSAQAVAELGFVVVQIDGMGTSNRSKAFHDICWKNLGDSGFPDRILWIKAAAKKYPYLDTSRVGIYGGSAGGQSSTRAMLAHGEFYKAAVSDCGCHDNRMDKIWWNELWMSWPIGPHYKEQSNVTQAHRLTGKLFLTVGELDRNVDPASTMQVVNALIKANKDFDMLVVPGGGHGVGESAYGKRRRRDFFVRHLLGVEPRSR
jgi:dipeptidyl-peptidase 4